MLMITTKSTYLLSPIHEIKPLASETFSLDEINNFFSVESMKNHEKSCFVCSDFFQQWAVTDIILQIFCFYIFSGSVHPLETYFDTKACFHP